MEFIGDKFSNASAEATKVTKEPNQDEPYYFSIPLLCRYLFLMILAGDG